MEPAVLQSTIAGNSVQNYLLASATFVGSLFALQIVKSIIIARIQAFSQKTENRWDDVASTVLGSFGWVFYFVIALYTSVQFLELRGFIHSLINALTLIIVTFYAIRALQHILINLLRITLGKSSDAEIPDKTILSFLENAIKATLWMGAVILILQNLGYEVGALVGGLGIVGIAIAFSLQTILEDIFSFFSIYFDKPFKKDDFIIVGNDSGTVEHIGMKTTRIKTLQGEELIISNRELTQARVNNFKRMEHRRVVFSFGIIYETPTKTVKMIPSIIQKIIEREQLAEFGRAHFKSFGDSSLDFEVVYYVKSNEYIQYMNTQQSINIALMEQFAKEKIEFAYPTKVVYQK